VISVHSKFRQNKILLGAMAEYEKSGVMPWLSLNVDSFEGKLEHVPQRQEITDMIDIREQLVVELYSK
jgi:small subunit ribosomal protein S4